MQPDLKTCWDLIEQAASGDHVGQQEFTQLYMPLVKRYLQERWKSSRLAQEIEDAVQEVFVECIRDRGILQQVDPGRGTSFRAFLLGATRNVARRIERKAMGKHAHDQEVTSFLDGIESNEERLTQLFEKDWAQAALRGASQLHQDRATEKGGNALVRWQVLGYHFGEGLTAPAIAERIQADVSNVHKWLSRGRQDFAECLHHVVARQFREGTPAEEIQLECQRMLDALK